MRRAAIALFCVLSPSTASAATWNARHQTSNFSMSIGAPDAAVCVVYPENLRSDACESVDFDQFGPQSLDESVAVVRAAGSVITVEVVSLEGHGSEITAVESRAWHTRYVADLHRTTPPGVKVDTGPMLPLRVHGLQAFRMRSEFSAQNLSTVETTYFVVGRDGVTVVKFVFAREHEGAAEPAIAAMVDSFDTVPARSIDARIAGTLLSLLAGAPLVVLAAAIASRKRPGDD